MEELAVCICVCVCVCVFVCLQFDFLGRWFVVGRVGEESPSVVSPVLRRRWPVPTRHPPPWTWTVCVSVCVSLCASLYVCVSVCLCARTSLCVCALNQQCSGKGCFLISFIGCFCAFSNVFHCWIHFPVVHQIRDWTAKYLIRLASSVSSSWYHYIQMSAFNVTIVLIVMLYCVMSIRAARFGEKVILRLLWTILRFAIAIAI